MPPLKTFNTWSFSLGVPHDMLFHSHHLTYRMMSVIVLQFLTFLLLLLKSVSQFLRPYRRLGSHNDPQDKLYQQPPASLLGNNRRKIKQVKPMWGWFHTPWGGWGRFLRKMQGLWQAPDSPIPLNHCQFHYFFGIKQKLFLCSFYSLSLLSLVYVTKPSKTNNSNTSTFSAFYRKDCSNLTTAPCITLSHTFLLPLAISLYAPPLSHAQMKTIAG